MVQAIAAVLLAVQLGGAFGDASATVLSTSGESMQVDIHVEVDGTTDSVLAHLALPGEPTVTLPLLEREPGLYGINTELRVADYAVVFEILATPSHQSQPVLLSEMGAEIGGSEGAANTSAEDDPATADTSGWLWLAIAFGAASLSALAFWVLGGSDEEDEEEEVGGEEAEPDQTSDSVSIDS